MRFPLVFTARCHAPSSPWSVQPFSGNAPSQACESAITNLDNALCIIQPAYCKQADNAPDKYETNYAPNVTQRAVHQRYDTVNTIRNTAAKNPLRAPTYFYNPRSVAAPRPPAPHYARIIKFRISRTNGGQSNHAIYR